MSKSTHQVAIKGVDQTSAAFNSVKNRAKATGASIRAVMGGAIAAAGTYLSFRAIKGSIDELGKLSDQAMKSGASVEFLTQAATAFQVAGLNIGVDQLTLAMQRLEKTTGKSGEGAFFDTIEQLAQIEDPAKRGAEATKLLGRSALELQPLINGGAEAVRKFRDLQSIMPGVSSAAANAGDEAADAMTIFGKGAQAIMLKAVGKICALWGEEFPGGVRAGALNAYNAIETFARKSWAWIQKLGTQIGAFAGFLSNVFDVGLSDAATIFSDQLDDADRIYESAIEAANAKREEYKAKLRTMSVDDLANLFGRNSQKGTEEVAAAASRARISNTLISGGSNAASKLAAFGPDYQNESRKQTRLLEDIAKNTKKTAEDDGEDYTPTDL